MQVSPPSGVSAGRAVLRTSLVAGLGLAAALSAAPSVPPAAAETRPADLRVARAVPRVDVEVVAELGESEERPRTPVLVLEGSELALFVSTEGGWRRRAWTDEGLSESREVAEPPFGAGAEPELDALVAPVAPVAPGAREEPTRVSSSVWRNGRLWGDGRALGWCPDAAGAHAVFDRFGDGDHDVVYRAPSGAETVLAGSGRFEAHATVCADGDGRVFVAWDEGGERWGRGGALHRERALGLAVLEDGAWRRLGLPPLLEGANGKAREGYSTAELPRLVAGADGALWLFYRAMDRWDRLETDGRRGSPDTGSNRRVMWQWRVAVLGEEGWSEPVTLPESDGAGYDGLAVLALPDGGVAACYESDGRAREFPRAAPWNVPLAKEAKLVAARLELRAGPARVAGAEPLATGRTAPPTRRAPSDPGSSRAGAEASATGAYLRLWGDLHRHSDLSRCKMDLDGNQLAQYRYAIDVEALDFLAITEHYQHLTPGHWAHARELAERFDGPGGLVTLFGFEQAQEDGHRNLFCIDPEEAEDAPFREWNPRFPWLAFPAGRWLAIPHQLADPQVPLDWPEQRPAIESVVEIYQSRRGSYVSSDDYLRSLGAARAHPHALDYLADGRQFGFVAASDHLTTGAAFTAVYARERTREGVFEALEARRTYAATARIALEVELGGAVVGGEASVAPGDELAVRVDAGAPLARVELLLGGVVARTWAGDPVREPRLLTIRADSASTEARVLVQLEGARWVGSPRSLRQLSGGTPETTEAGVLLDVDVAAYDESALVGAIEVEREAGATPLVRLVRHRSEVEVPLEALEAGALAVERVGPVRAELRLDPPALGESSLDASWAPDAWRVGDWVVVRVVRADGEMAWSSPIRVTEVRP